MKFDLNILGYISDLFAMRHEPEGVRVLSNLYWRAIIVTTLLVVGAVFIYGITGLLRVLDKLSTASGVSTPPPALDRAALDAVVDGFKKRQSQFDALKSGTGKSISDPSR